MKDLKEVKELVKQVLLDRPETRKSDKQLILAVLEEIGLDTKQSIESVLNDPRVPSFAGITRARRKVQEKNPLLKDEKTAEMRAEAEQDFIDFARGL